MENRAIIDWGIRRYGADGWESVKDQLVVEEPLEIQLLFGAKERRQRKSIAVTMRTPGHDFELAVGFLWTEGIIQQRSDVVKVAYAHAWLPEQIDNTVVVVLDADVVVDLKKLERHFYTSSSCGVCGKSSLEAIERTGIQSVQPIEVDPKIILSLPEKLRAAQTVFDKTGGIHAAGLFDLDGNLLNWREDVGRHNALDKLLGNSFLNNKFALSKSILMLSGRVSFELVQKAVVGGIPVIVAVGAPSSLAVEMAERFGVRVIGFVKRAGFNLYEYRISST